VTSPSEALVCVIDDDQFVRESLVLLLTCSDYRALGFEDAESFLNAGAAADADLLIIDVGLPGMNGLALIKRLNEAGLTRPVIVITGHADGSDLQGTTPPGLVAFLHKPVDPPELLQVIERSLSGRDSG